MSLSVNMYQIEDSRWKVVYHENGVPMEQIFDSNEEASLFYGQVMLTSN